ncbi:MAG: hypothetical protein M5U34_19005 [Chloroflexi bacterium]|nr:hypothetical protein [Chloroflexota bacterium]
MSALCTWERGQLVRPVHLGARTACPPYAGETPALHALELYGGGG